jgi:hypothetical protein
MRLHRQQSAAGAAGAWRLIRAWMPAERLKGCPFFPGAMRFRTDQALEVKPLSLFLLTYPTYIGERSHIAFPTSEGRGGTQPSRVASALGVFALELMVERVMPNSLSRLIEMAKALRVTDEQREEQRRSLVYGNTAFENENITREMVDRQAEKQQTK